MFKAEKSALLAALALTGSVVEKRGTMPILQNVLIDRDGDKLVTRLTNLDIEAKTSFAAVLIDPDFEPFTVQASTLSDIVRKLPDGAEISVERPKAGKVDSILLKAGRSRFSLQVLPATDFPEMSMNYDASCVVTAAADLSAAITACSHAISTEETRYYLNGIFLHPSPDGEGATLVSTDGHRLVKRVIKAEIAADLPGVIIPRQAIRVLTKILPEKGNVELQVTDALIRITGGSAIVTSKLIDGTFPDYQRVIPSAGEMQAIVDTKTVAAAVDRVATLSGERGRCASFTFADQQLRLRVNNPDAGDAEEELTYEGQAAIEIGFNAKYVAEAVSHLSGDQLTMALSDPNAPAVLRTLGGNPENLIVLMPMRI